MTYPCKDCIIDMLESSGPQDLNDLRRECHTQAVPYTPALFDLAIGELLGEGKVVADVEREDTKPVVVIDFPESYYLAKVS